MAGLLHGRAARHHLGARETPCAWPGGAQHMATGTSLLRARFSGRKPRAAPPAVDLAPIAELSPPSKVPHRTQEGGGLQLNRDAPARGRSHSSRLSPPPPSHIWKHWHLRVSSPPLSSDREDGAAPASILGQLPEGGRVWGAWVPLPEGLLLLALSSR